MGSTPPGGASAVSVLMCAYNSERYVTEAIDSVLGQTWSDWEIVFLDNRSMDRTEDIVRSYRDPRIRYLRPPQSLTLAECRNVAARDARGEWLAFLDADDVWLPNKLERQMARVREDGGDDVGMVYARTLSFSARGDEGETIYRYAGRDLPEGRILRNLLLEGCLVPLVSAMVRRTAYWALGGIPADYTFAEDYYLFVAVAERHRVLCVQTPCCRYRVHPQSMTAGRKTTSHRESMKILQAWSGHVAPAEYRRRMAVYETLIGTETILSGRYGGGVRHILRHGSIPFLVRGTVATAYRRFIRRQRPTN